jgi:Glutathione-dependent formaldehyde-activating enzyme
MKIDGGCHCGYITYEAEADPEKTTICHCTDCQRLSGSAFRTVVRVPGDTFKIIAGEPTIYLKTAELFKDRRKRRKTSARILPPMRNANLLDRRRRRAEILLHPCGDCTPTRCACPEGTDLVALTTALGQ